MTNKSQLLDATELVLESFDKIELFVLDFIKNGKLNTKPNTNLKPSIQTQNLVDDKIEVEVEIK